MTDVRVRVRPCAFCPYRRDVPSGVWATEEYDVLRRFDGDIADQAAAGAVRPFACHASPECLCAGWVGHRDPTDLLALRIGVCHDLDPSVMDYRTDVPLWESGAAAADHGQADIDNPDDRAAAAVRKLVHADPTRLHPTAAALEEP